MTANKKRKNEKFILRRLLNLFRNFLSLTPTCFKLSPEKIKTLGFHDDAA